MENVLPLKAIYIYLTLKCQVTKVSATQAKVIALAHQTAE
jgi:hypothetical protein